MKIKESVHYNGKIRILAEGIDLATKPQLFCILKQLVNQGYTARRELKQIVPMVYFIS